MDDSPLNRLVLRRTLEAAGATVTEAADGLEAFELYRSAGGAQTFGLILMDLVMPCDGWTATAHIRALERAHAWRPAHIVACTSECIAPGSVALQRCWDVGMSGVLVSARRGCRAQTAASGARGWGRVSAAASCALFTSSPPHPTAPACRARR